MPESPRERRSGLGRARGTSPRVVRGHRIRASFAAALLVPQLAGCYHYVPVTAPGGPGGADVSVGITDRGRVALAAQLGQEVRRVEGRLAESTDSTLVLSVARVRHLDVSVVDQWAGERVSLSRNYVSEIRERRISRSRTLLASGIVAAVVLAATQIALRGFGDDSGGTKPPGGGPGEQ